MSVVRGALGWLRRSCRPWQLPGCATGAVQCGFCTPGLLVGVADLLARDHRPDESTIREALAGPLCRCTGYQKIVDAVRLAAARAEGRA